MPSPLSELIKLNDQRVSDVEGISDLLQDAPFFRAIVADEASNGTTHKYLKETGAPTVGFRAINDGRVHDNSEDTIVSIDLKILDASFHVDKRIADEYEKGGPDAWIQRELQRHIRAAFAQGEQQVIYGSGNDADGFTGLADASTIDDLNDPMVVNAGGSSNLSSVYAVRSVGDMTDFLLVMGLGGRIDVPAYFMQLMDGSVTGKFPAYVQPADALLGVQVGSAYSVGRIANIDDGSNTLDDSLMSQLLSKAPATRPFTHLLMNRRSHQQLQASRTATNPTGQPAPFPTESFGIPIVVSDQVSSAETALTI